MSAVTGHPNALVVLAGVVIAGILVVLGALRVAAAVKRFRTRLAGYATLPLGTDVALAQTRLARAAARANELPLIEARAEAAFAAIALARAQIAVLLGNEAVWWRIGLGMLIPLPAPRARAERTPGS